FLKDSWPLIFIGLMLAVQTRIDGIMIREMLGDRQAGYYGVSLRLIESLTFLPVIVGSSLFPAVVRAKSVSEDLYKFRLLNYYRLNFVIFLIVAVPIFLFSDWIVKLIYGTEFSSASGLLSLMATRL